jgi:hypothetical protein
MSVSMRTHDLHPDHDRRVWHADGIPETWWNGSVNWIQFTEPKPNGDTPLGQLGQLGWAGVVCGCGQIGRRWPRWAVTLTVTVIDLVQDCVPLCHLPRV